MCVHIEESFLCTSSFFLLRGKLHLNMAPIFFSLYIVQTKSCILRGNMKVQYYLYIYFTCYVRIFKSRRSHDLAISRHWFYIYFTFSYQIDALMSIDFTYNIHFYIHFVFHITIWSCLRLYLRRVILPTLLHIRLIYSLNSTVKTSYV